MVSFSPMVRNSIYWDYLRKTLYWLIGNLLFGLAPLLFMCVVYAIAEQKIGGPVIDQLVHDGVVPFVCCAIMGSILLDYALGGYSFTPYQVFTIFGFPIGILMILCLNYLFIRIHIVPEDRFDLFSYTSILVIVLSVVYSLVAKTHLFAREDTKYQNR